MIQGKFETLFNNMQLSQRHPHAEAEGPVSYTDGKLLEMIQILRNAILDLQLAVPSAASIPLGEPNTTNETPRPYEYKTDVYAKERDLYAQIESLNDEVGRLETVEKDLRTSFSKAIDNNTELSTKVFELEHAVKVCKAYPAGEQKFYTAAGYQTVISDLKTKLKNEREFARKWRDSAHKLQAEKERDAAGENPNMLIMEDIRAIFEMMKNDTSVLINVHQLDPHSARSYHMTLVNSEYDRNGHSLEFVSDTLAHSGPQETFEESSHILRGRVENLIQAAILL